MLPESPPPTPSSSSDSRDLKYSSCSVDASSSKTVVNNGRTGMTLLLKTNPPRKTPLINTFGLQISNGGITPQCSIKPQTIPAKCLHKHREMRACRGTSTSIMDIEKI